MTILINWTCLRYKTRIVRRQEFPILRVNRVYLIALAHNKDTYRPRQEKVGHRAYGNSKDPDQPARQHNLIRTFVKHRYILQ